MDKETFEIKEEHLKLIKNSYVGFNDSMYFGAPCINIKYPYGNSDVLRDIANILDWEYEQSDDFQLPLEQEKLALKLHRELEKVLEICFSLLKFEIGIYNKISDKWIKHSILWKIT